MDERQTQLANWAAATLALPEGETRLTTVSGDASFRRYFRLKLTSRTVIAVDAPPEHEDNPRFVKVAQLMREAGVCVPEIIAADLAQGFLLLSDLGDELYLPALLQSQESGTSDVAEHLYGLAITALVQLQQGVDKERLDPYDRNQLRTEMALFDEWFCRGLMELELDPGEMAVIEQAYDFLEEAALAQTQVAVHRDYHSRNLMVLDGKSETMTGPGVIDFQDAVSGAYTYDLVSMLRDCYIRWPVEQVEQWALVYLREATAANVLVDITPATLMRDFDLMGLQRHFKVLGIFSRLSLRDNKTGYLADIPLVIRYFLEVADKYPEMAEFVAWFRQRVLPVATDKLNLDRECEQ